MHQPLTEAAISLVPWILVLGITVYGLRAVGHWQDQRRLAQRQQWQARSAEADRALAAYLASVLRRPTEVPACLRQLGLGLPSSAQQVREAHRELAKQHHPDVGGAHARMQQLNLAREQALAWLAAHPTHATSPA